MKAMRELGEKKSQVHIFTGDGRGQNTEILDGILRHIEIQRFNKCGLGGQGTRRLDLHTTVKGTEARKIRFETRREFVRSLDMITMNVHVVRAWLDGDARQTHSDEAIGSRRLDCVPRLSRSRIS
jgi:hypothetical protein